MPNAAVTASTAHGDDIYEHGGFGVHFFPRTLVAAVAQGWYLTEVHAFDSRTNENLPRPGRAG
ncbi:hypothetical protein [Streptomyces sp. NPDC054787]